MKMKFKLQFSDEIQVTRYTPSKLGRYKICKNPYGESRSISCILYLVSLYLFNKPKFEILACTKKTTVSYETVVFSVEGKSYLSSR
jgi:hypothetical protein